MLITTNTARFFYWKSGFFSLYWFLISGRARLVDCDFQATSEHQYPNHSNRGFWWIWGHNNWGIHPPKMNMNIWIVSLMKHHWLFYKHCTSGCLPIWTKISPEINSYHKQDTSWWRSCAFFSRISNETFPWLKNLVMCGYQRRANYPSKNL